MNEVSFKAPWGAPLILMTAVCLVLCLIIPLPGLLIGFGHGAVLGVKTIPKWTGWILIIVPLLTIAGSAAFMVRGYRVSGGALRVQRLGWETCIDLSRLMSVTFDPEALKGSLRLFGNGGFFCFAGWFRNSKLGVYRAFATDSTRAVVLRFSNRTVVVTPDDPRRFVAEVRPPHSAP